MVSTEQQWEDCDFIENERALKQLARAISLSQGQFSLILVRCNYVQLREKVLKQLSEVLKARSPKITDEIPPFRCLQLSPDINHLYHTVKADFALTEDRPSALLVLGLESVINLEDILISTNVIRDEFRKQLNCPLVLWVNDRLLHQFLQLAPDFANFAANPISFEMTTEALSTLIIQKAQTLLDNLLSRDKKQLLAFPLSFISPKQGGCGQHRAELEFALSTLERRETVFDASLEARVAILLGHDRLMQGQIEGAIDSYQTALNYEQQLSPQPNLEHQGLLLFYLGLCSFYPAQENPENQQLWEQAWHYFYQAIQCFQDADRQDLMAQMTGQVSDVLQHLQAWETLVEFTQKSLDLHQQYGLPIQLALDYGFLGKLALEQGKWEIAREQLKQCLAILDSAATPPIDQDFPPLPQGLYPLLWSQLFQLQLVQCLRHLKHYEQAYQTLAAAKHKLEYAITQSNARHDPHRYLRLLKGLRSLYFDEQCYREAFLLKQEKRSVQSQYGLRPFVGAGQLRPAQQALNPLLANRIETDAQVGEVAEAISTSNRQKDVQNLLYRISRPDYKITVIHGPSGVGKSSIVSAGLVPTLHRTTLGDQIPVPVVIRVYSDWVLNFGKAFNESLKHFQFTPREISDYTPEIYLQAFDQIADQSGLTVLIFDQFEEFFFVCTELEKRQAFYQFLEQCINQAGLKIIFSIREDYLHHLLEIEQNISLEAIACNLLDKSNRYALGNFSKAHTFEVIKNLTQKTKFELDDDLIEALVNDLSVGTNEVRPIELQIVGSQLQELNITTLEQYLQVESKHKLVEKFLESVIADCGEKNEYHARKVVYTFIDEDDNRPLKTKSEILAQMGSDLAPETLELILDIFFGSGLIYPIPEQPEPRYQLVHDYLVEFIQTQKQQAIHQERSQLQEENAQNQKEIEDLRDENLLISQLAEERYKAVQQDLEDYIPNSNHSASESESIDQEKKRLSKGKLVLENLRQEKTLLTALAQAKAKHKKSERQRKLILNSLLVGAGFFILGLGGFAWNGVINQIKTLGTSSEALVGLNNEIEGLTTGLKAGEQIKSTPFLPKSVSDTIEKTLSYAVYRISEENRLEAHKDGVYAATFSPDGKLIATAGEDRTIRIWDEQGKPGFTIPGHQDIITSLVFLEDGKWLASGSWDHSIKLWNLGKFPDLGKIANLDRIEYVELKGHTDQVIALAAHQDPKNPLIASASRDQTVKIWRKDGSEVVTLSHDFPVLSVVFSPDGQLVATASFDGKIRFWSLDGSLVKTFVGEPEVQEIYSMSWSERGLLATAGQVIDEETGQKKGTVSFWTEEGFLTQIEAHEDTVLDVRFSPNGKQFVTASKDKTIKIWGGLDNNSLQKTLIGHTHWVPKVGFSPDGSRIVSASLDKSVKVWRLNKSLMEVWDGGGALNGVSVSGSKIATIGDYGMITLWQPDGTVLKSWKGHEGQVWGVDFTPDGQQLVTAGDDLQVKVWNLKGELLQTLEGHRDVVLSVSVSPDGKYIASGSKDYRVKLWRTDGTLLKTLFTDSSAINWVSFSPDGQLVAAASDEGRVKLWRTDGTQVGTLRHRAGVWGVTFSPDGQAIATASYDSRVKLWNRQGQLLGEPLEHEGNTVTSVAFSPDGEQLASASHNTIRLWRKDGTLLHVLTASSHRSINGLSFTSDGKTLISVGGDGQVTLWHLDQLELDQLLETGCQWLQGYLENNPTGQKERLSVCD
ncbi:hypothetical protein PN466_09050 [Roseofilum reptotaenium CS-1145]|uniref:Novel STAND NTPase 1 domain-containing protein n=1 Tax=Roseofilum reptotaenium AO1-A TaxID=1925591 RepID=A0A1L9QNB2_9CYAN|nr:hypothetical protein [Roseofilum reptotaenium]MDB9517094.1 hypothetical protein [Roseofilum reptotaenium CS-1145]OJJ24161.1 hypothetical protein BI308_18000 [Roseofilum reptotaenium AO1-A]